MASERDEGSLGVVNFGDMERNTGLTGADSAVRPSPPTYREFVVVKLAI